MTNEAKPKVLIIDDEYDLAEIVAFFIEDEFESQIAMDSDNIVELLKNNKYQLILTDLEMPIMNGYEVIECIKEHQPGTPVILLSGHGISDPKVIKALELGASGLLNKPFEGQDEVVAFLKTKLTVEAA